MFPTPAVSIRKWKRGFRQAQIQLHNSEGSCWDTRFFPFNVDTDDPGRFRALGK